ncbi:MAG: Stp1/IreP family PP2C-type Ser/Thr phosphatase [Myxococcales bacterium]|nr:Stp1/IreP family PP2C-type Ser/Thr phosphatase [Myxococcales bacterium]
MSARSDVGRVRTKNEDAFSVADLDDGARLESGPAPRSFDVRARGILLVVSDGMGGHAAGEVASAMVVDSLRRSLEVPGLDTSSMQRLIDNAVKRANTDVFEAARATRKAGMGATLTAVLVHHHEAYVAGVGDSRAYILRQGRLRQITKDQSFVQLLVDAGALTLEEAKLSNQKNLILQGMGLKDDVQVSIGRLQLRRGDRLLLCSDGLSNLVSDDELRAVLISERDLAAACERTIELANSRGGDDNITAIVAALDGEGLPLPTTTETLTQTFEILQAYDPGGPAARPRPDAPAASPAAAAPAAATPAAATPAAAAPAAAAPAAAAPAAAAPAPAAGTPAGATRPPRRSWLPYLLIALVVLGAGVAFALLR